MADEEDVVVTSAAAIIIAVDVVARKLLKRRRSCWVRPCYQICLGSLWSRITLINIHEHST